MIYVYIHVCTINKFSLLTVHYFSNIIIIYLTTNMEHTFYDDM